ncbi:RagB/SusD family nutrient uptake outer membrane protein [Flavivirga aquimarina]|uniref:RagB/SusD family nutrient uptake outer membrane protein n=1 Tax=Flavivirga aquimarina TaxID=2027862 RepID=A0ABT8WF26_9FLAO|nr:RagB/SusD family nutrient uptake outer membrane protein [Flavivirga aquimarina]MDO5971759.1 RagB/SusD family nutrient uptake outer membrane protein [Flavivirga aquimarina]
MKKTIIMSLSAVLFFLVGCEDTFLDLKDLDSITEEVFFDVPQDFEDASNHFYRGLHSPTVRNPGNGSANNNGFNMITDFGTELNAWVQNWGQGINTATDIDIYWGNSYYYIRETNILLQKADEYVDNGGSAAEISEYVATAYFFRAYHHFRLLKRFGGVPIVTEVTNVDSEILFAPRNSRYEVAAQILADLDLAIASLPTSATGEDLGKISATAALAYKARVLLFEGTFEKYVGTATDFEGSGTGNNSAAYIAEAVTTAKMVMDSGAYEIWNQNADPNMDNNSYKWLFTLEGTDSNPGGYTKASNNEFIIQTIYSFPDNTIGSIFTQVAEERNAPTQVALDMYSCLDGLPIDKSLQFQGYAKQSDQFINRDRRMWANFGRSIPADGSNIITELGTTILTNLSNWKWRTWNQYRSVRTEAYNYPHLRYAEVLLTYAEALYERDGSISDADLNLTVNLIRDRAGIAPLTNTLVTANNLNMLEEIRRERTVELYMEDNNHWNDLHRWDIAKDVLNDDLIGYVIEGTEYENDTDLFDPAIAIYDFKDDYPSGKGPVRALIIDPVSTRVYSHKNYLWPLPINETVRNPNLLQNPDW